MIKLSHLDFAYTKRKLFSNLSLKLEAGNIYGLLGKNGAGKTTLLKIISGLLFPESGEIHVAGFIPRLRKPDFLQEIFFLPEEYTLPGLKMIDYKKLYAPFYPAFSEDRFLALVEKFKLPVDQKLNSFSHGQKKKFLLSFGIACNSRIFLLDEPTNGLDIPSKTQFRKIIASAGSDNRIIIISTHQVRDVENLIDPLVIMDNGKVIFNYSIEQVTQKISVKTMAEKPTDNTVLYIEEELNGFRVVMANKEGDEKPIDLETIFNTVITNPVGIQNLFAGEYNHEN